MKPLLFCIQFTLTTLLTVHVHELKAQGYSRDVFTVIEKMDSVLVLNSIGDKGYWLESRTIGEGSSKSNIYPLYKELLEAAETQELLRIIEDSTLKPPVRGYSYMAYAYHVDSLQIPEQVIDCDFKLNVQIGCIGTHQSFQNFKPQARVRGLNNPYPKKFTYSTEEEKAIDIENKIRAEQEEPKRKEKTE